MCSEAQARVLFGLDYGAERWHLAYGVTSNRWNAMLRDDRNPASFFHDRSEVALTFFVLGRLDAWTQDACFRELPRHTDGEGWNPAFFDNLLGGRPNYRPDPPYNKADSGWQELLPRVLVPAAESSGSSPLAESCLLFEFDTGGVDFNSAVRSELAPFSFLRLGSSGLGHLFDAALILPKRSPPTFVFFECKLGSDMGLSLEHWPFVNQFVRALESAYLLTRLEGSPYHGWDFRYIVVSPEDVFRERMTHYAHAIDDPTDHLRRHRRFIEHRYRHLIIEERMAAYDDFVSVASQRVGHLSWDTMMRAVPRFGFARYREELLTAGFAADKVQRILDRFRIADVTVV